MLHSTTGMQAAAFGLWKTARVIMQHQILQKNITIKSEKFCDFFFFTSVLQDSFSVFIPLTK